MSIVRVHYRERQRLSAADMRLEQDYRLGLGGRHGLAHHDWGIVRGLRIAVQGGSILLTPGSAIDGYGREIVVPHPLALDVDGLNLKQCWHVLLYYCEEAQPAAAARCGNQPAPRIGPRPVAQVVARERAPAAPSMNDPARARAAGTEGLEPWPVLVAAIGTGCNDTRQFVDYALTRYASHRGSLIRAPNGRATMQLGLASPMDFYHFLLSTRDAASGMVRRIGIDRHAAVHVWRPLWIAASKAAARVNIGNELQLRISAPMPAGLGSRVTIEGRLDAQFHTLTASLRGAAVPFAATGAHAQLTKSNAALEFQDGSLGAAMLFDTKKLRPISFANARKRVPASANTVTTFSVPGIPADARLVLKNVEHGPAPSDSPECDIPRTRAAAAAAASDLSGLLFRPAKAIEASPLAREIHAVETSLPGDPVPATALRISGGAGDDTDAATRVSIGATIAGNYRAAVRMDAGRRIGILGLSTQGETPVLKVDGTAYLPPIGPKDPLLPELLMLAYIGGLRRIGNVTTAVTMTLTLTDPGAPGAAPQGTPFRYFIAVRSAPPGGTYTVKRIMELVTGKDGKGDLTFRTLELPPLPATATGNGARAVRLPDFRRAEPRAEVSVLMLVEIGQKVRVVVSNILPIDLPASPH